MLRSAHFRASNAGILACLVFLALAATAQEPGIVRDGDRWRRDFYGTQPAAKRLRINAHGPVTLQAGTVEQDRLGRQKFESGVGPVRQGLLDDRGPAGRPVDLLRCGSCDMRRRSWGELDTDIQPVTGDEPARCRDDYRDRRIA